MCLFYFHKKHTDVCLYFFGTNILCVFIIILYNDIYMQSCIYKNREMIFEQPFFDNFYDNFLSHTHIMFLLFLSNALVSVPILIFLYIFKLSQWLSTKMDVQISLLTKIIWRVGMSDCQDSLLYCARQAVLLLLSFTCDTYKFKTI
jgi:hypothetical protein